RRGRKVSSTPGACGRTGSPTSPTPTTRAGSRSSPSRAATWTRTTRNSRPRIRPASRSRQAARAGRSAPTPAAVPAVGHERHHVPAGGRDEPPQRARSWAGPAAPPSPGAGGRRGPLGSPGGGGGPRPPARLPRGGGAGHAGGGPAASGYPTSVSTIARRLLQSQTNVSATLGYAGDYTVTGHGGTITWLPAAGRVIRQGQILYRVGNGTPVFLLYGRV